MRKIYLFFILLFAFVQVGFGQPWTEDFNSEHSGSYGTGTISLSSRDWTRKDAGNFSYANSTMGSYAFTINDDKAGAHITTPSLNTCGTVSFKYAYKSGNSSNIFKLQKSTDGTTFSDLDTHTLGASSELNYVSYSFDVNDASATVYIRVLSDNQNAHLFIEDFSVTANGGIANPTAFSASAGGTDNIDLSWTQNGNSDNVMVAYNTSDSFGTPTDGNAYTVGNTIAGGGEVIFNGNGASYNHSGLTANTTYYYKAWSVDGSTNYSSGVTTNAVTTKAEPTNHLTAFAGVASGTTINLSWTDATGATLPDGYLILANKTGSFTDPVDGTEQTDATDANGGRVNISYGDQAYSWTGLDASTQYYFKAWAYTNSGSHIDYKTDETVPITNASTDAPASVPDLIITEIMQNSSAVDDSKGEWFEIYNNEDSDIDINGYTIKDDGSDSHTISSSVVISSKDFVVLGINNDSGTNGGLTVNYQYTSFTLGNGADEVVLVYTDGSTEVDRVNYDGGTNFPDPTGASMILTNLSLDNNVGANWGTSTQREGSWGTGGTGDKGSPGVIGSEVVLPVELISFTATDVNGGVMLNWTTATEVNNYGFDVEAEVAGNWTNIGFVLGHGNSNSPKEYSYFDNSGATSYRLKQLDTDGGFEYSDVVTVSGSLAKTELYQNIPNPFNPSTQIKFSLSEATSVNVSVYNMLGQKVAELLNQNVVAGEHSINFDAGNYSSGFYFYRLETPSYSKTMKMLLLK